jgi:cobalt-zinc-cadmium resistance protein CzcA
MNFALTVRLAEEYRRNVDAIRSVPVALPNSDPRAPTAYIALGELGDVRLETGAAYIYRENNQRFVPLKVKRTRPRSCSTVAGGSSASAQGEGQAQLWTPSSARWGGAGLATSSTQSP